MSNVHASLILSSLKDSGNNRILRKGVAVWYNIYIPEEYHMPQRDEVWVYDLRLPNFKIGNFVVECLNKENIAARHGFKPLSGQPEYYREHWHPTPNSKEAANRIMYLPVHPDMDEALVRQTSQKLVEAVGLAQQQR